MTTAPDIPPRPPRLPSGPPRLPSWRVSAALAAAMLAIGVAVGAAIGPAPGTSFAGEPVRQLLPTIAALAGAGHTSQTTAQAQAAQPPPVTPQATPSSAAVASRSSSPRSDTTTRSTSAQPKTPARGVVSPTATPHAPKPDTPTTRGSAPGKQLALPPVTSVWLIELAGGTFAQALAQPAATPYSDAQLVPAGTLLSGWSALAGSALASEASLLAGTAPQTLTTIIQPPCPEGAPGASCKPETAGALSAADAFLHQTVPAITASAAYREHGLIVVTFGAIGNATASGLPAGTATTTLSSAPAGGVLLLSPFAHAGTRSSTPYDPTSPKQSLSGLLH